MTERVLGPTGGRRRKRLALLVPFIAIAALILAIAASAGPVGTAAGFEDDDGNLAPAAPINFDWNSFATTSWSGTAPYKTSAKTVSGWSFTGLQDDEATTSDTNFNGGVKQDDDCAATGGGKSSNKDDLKRVYIASNTVGGDVFLELAWVRIPQNTTSPSAHIAFEFNQAAAGSACGGSSPLVHRSTANGGDMLIVYDFEGGATDTPHITLRRWVGSGACEVSSDSAPCWGPAADLTTLGFAEAKVNVSSTASDTIGPNSPASETLGLSEFGEAGINLTDSGVFGTSACTAFGKSYAVSRSSGNSGTAQMKDLVGPGNINITNCGAIKIRKVTVPSPDPNDTSFSYTATGGLSPSSFTLKNGGLRDYGSSVQQGTYGVSETNPTPTYTLSNIDCSASTTSHGSTISIGSDGDFDSGDLGISTVLKPLDTIDCTFTNTLNTGAIKVTKTGKSKACTGASSTCQGAGVALLSGATFEIWKETNNTAGLQTSGATPDTNVTSGSTGSDGTKCFDGLLFGGYYARETAAPAGYAIDGAVSTLKTISAAGTCPSTGTVVAASFTDTPLSQIRVTFHSKAGVGVTTATIQCSGTPDLPGGDDTSASNLADNSTGRLLDNLPPGTYDCQVIVDP
jgi:hypothetical protein